MLAGDDNVDLGGAVGDGLADLGEAQRQRRLARREARGHRGDGNPRALQRSDSVAHAVRIHAHGARRQAHVLQAQHLWARPAKKNNREYRSPG